MGLVIAVSSCKDSKKADADENGSDKVEKIQKLTKINSAADLDNLDMDNLDLDDLAKLDDLEGLDDLNFDEIYTGHSRTPFGKDHLSKVMQLVTKVIESPPGTVGNPNNDEDFPGYSLEGDGCWISFPFPCPPSTRRVIGA